MALTALARAPRCEAEVAGGSTARDRLVSRREGHSACVGRSALGCWPLCWCSSFSAAQYKQLLGPSMLIASKAAYASSTAPNLLLLCGPPAGECLCRQDVTL